MGDVNVAKLFFEVAKACPVGACVNGWPSSFCDQFDGCDPEVEGITCWCRWLELRGGGNGHDDGDLGS